jgi:DNA-binding CsgD family transcriptional regulator
MNDYTWNGEGKVDEFASDLEERLGVLTPRSGSFVPRELSDEEIEDAAHLAKQMSYKRRAVRLMIAAGLVFALAMGILLY